MCTHYQRCDKAGSLVQYGERRLLRSAARSRGCIRFDYFHARKELLRRRIKRQVTRRWKKQKENERKRKRRGGDREKKRNREGQREPLNRPSRKRNALNAAVRVLLHARAHGQTR